MDSEELKRRTKDFSHRCVKLALALAKGPLGDHVRKQLIRCGTSVGANYRAACVARSRPDFAAKLGIAIEEVDESCFWLEFIIDECLLKENRVVPLLTEGRELTSILVKSRKTTRARASDK